VTQTSPQPPVSQAVSHAPALGPAPAAAVGPTAAGPARRRVVHVIDSLAGSGGAENRLVDEVIALSDRFDQTVVRIFERDFLESRLADAGIPVVALGFSSGSAGWTWPLAASHLARVLAEVRPDVVHTSLFAGNLIGQIAATRQGLPVVSTFNRSGDADVLRALVPGIASWKARTMQAVGRRVAHRGDVHYRPLGAHVRDTNCAAMGLPLYAATVIERGVAVDDEPSHEPCPHREALGVAQGAPLFVNTARVVPEKAQHLLVEAFALVRAELPDARLAIAGAPGAATARVREAIERAGLRGAVSLLGFRDDARALVRTADVFVFSSLSEGSPGAVVEALVLGTPVAAFGIPPVSELTDGDRHAWLAPPAEPQALADAMLAAWRAPDRPARAAATRACARQRYALASVARRLGDLLEARIATHPTAADAAVADAAVADAAVAGPGRRRR
jgi:glycosyltransferase involved in cell wall biosynthesis